jgi:hypothetical protein
MIEQRIKRTIGLKRDIIYAQYEHEMLFPSRVCFFNEKSGAASLLGLLRAFYIPLRWSSVAGFVL